MGLIKNEDAQFMLLAGFIIAIGLVITTVMLNNIIFESNMAGEAGGDPIKYDIVNLMRISGDEMKSAYRNATYVSAPKDNMIANFTNQMNNFSANLSKLYALHGEGVNVSWDVNNWNDGFYANFTDNGTVSGENLTLIENVKNVTIFELRNVSGSDLNVTVTNQNTGAVLWSMKLLGSDSIQVNSSIYIFNIPYSYIDLLNSSYNFNKSIGSNSYKISFIDGQKDNGKFKMVGYTTYGKNFTRSRDYILNTTVILSTSNKRATITIPVSVPW